MFASLEQNTYTLIIYAVYVDEVLAIVYYHYNIIHWQQDASILFVILYKRTRKRYQRNTESIDESSFDF